MTPAWWAALLWGASWLLPIHELPWLAFHADLLAAAALAVLVGATWREGAAPNRVPVSALVVLGLAAVPLLQAASGLILFAGDAWMSALYLCGLSLAIACGHAAARPEAGLGRAFGSVLLAVALVSALLALRQWLQLPSPHAWLQDVPPAARPVANVSQPNLLATLLLLGLIAALALHEAGALGTRWLTLAAGLLVAGMAVTQSRTAALGLLVAGLWLIAVRRRSGLRLRPTLLLAIAATYLVCVGLRPRLGPALHLAPPPADAPPPVNTRPIHWSTVWDAVLQAPWTGQGWNQVAVAQAHDRGTVHSGEFIEHSHNLLLDLLVWNGLPLGLAIAGAVAAWLWHRARSCRAPQSALLLAGIAALGVHAMTEYPLDYFAFLLPLGLAVGALDALAAPAATTVPVPRLATAAVALSAAALTVGVTIDYAALEADHALMRAQWAHPERQLPDPGAVPEVRLLTQLRALLLFMRADLGPGLDAAQWAAMRKVAERYGYAPVLTRLAIAESRAGRPEAAQSLLARLCRIHPQHACLDARRRLAADAATAPARPAPVEPG